MAARVQLVMVGSYMIPQIGVVEKCAALSIDGKAPVLMPIGVWLKRVKWLPKIWPNCYFDQSEAVQDYLLQTMVELAEQRYGSCAVIPKGNA